MKVFVTGATGFIGTAIVQELLQRGHAVLALARSQAAAASLSAVGVEVLRGDLQDAESLRRGALASDGVVHTAFNHDFSRYKEACELDRRAIEALGEPLRGTDKPMIVTSGTVAAPGRRGTEEGRYPKGASATTPRAASEEAADALVEQGARVGVVRASPSVHGEGDHGFVPMLIRIAKDKGASAYRGDGSNRWNAVHRLDAARVFVRALERTARGERFHAVGEPAIPFRDIATAIGRLLDVPVKGLSAEESEAHFGWLSWPVGLDCPCSSTITRERLDWSPTHPGLLDDLANGVYHR